MKNLNTLYWILTAVMLLDVILYLFVGISFRGYLVDWLLLWAWLIMTPVVIILQFKKRWVKGYSIMLVLLTVLSLIPMAIPILTLTFYAIDLEQKASYKLDSRITLKEDVKSVIAPLRLQVVKSYFLFEKIIAEDSEGFEVAGNYYRGLSNVEFVKQLNDGKNDSLRLAFKFKEGVVVKSF